VQEPLPDRELERQNALREQLRQIREAKVITTGNAAATRERAKAKGKAAAPVTTSLRGSLRNRSELRKAVITREVLGTPVGLR
jgi:ribosomal protein L17